MSTQITSYPDSPTTTVARKGVSPGHHVLDVNAGEECSLSILITLENVPVLVESLRAAADAMEAL